MARCKTGRQHPRLHPKEHFACQSAVHVDSALTPENAMAWDQTFGAAKATWIGMLKVGLLPLAWKERKIDEEISAAYAGAIATYRYAESASSSGVSLSCDCV